MTVVIPSNSITFAKSAASNMNEFLTRCFIGILNSLSRLSWNTLYKLSDALSFMIGRVVRYRGKVVDTNIRNSFPEKTEKERRQIADRFYRNVTDIMVESVKMGNASRQEITERLSLHSPIFDDYYADGKNMVVVLGHFGNWELANLFASLRFSHQVLVVYHKLANDTFEEWLHATRTKFGSELIPMKEAYTQAVTPREKPFLFFLVNDQSPHPGKAYWTRFLNQDTGVYRGVEKISRLLNAPVVYASIFRDEQKRGHYEVKVQKITDDPQSEPQNAIIEKQVEFLEKDIREQPHNWLWSHKRWKHKKPAVLTPDQLLEVTKS